MSPRRLFQIAAEPQTCAGPSSQVGCADQKMVADDFAFVSTPAAGSLLLGWRKVANRIFTGLVWED